MSLAFLHPIIDAFLIRGRAKEELASQLCIPVGALHDASVTLPANKVYSFLKWSANFTGSLFLLHALVNTWPQVAGLPLCL